MEKIEFTGEFKNPKYIGEIDSDSNRWIDLEIKVGEEWLPFTLNPKDKGSQFDTDLLYKRVVAAGSITAYTPPTQSELNTEKAKDMRELRDAILSSEVDPIVTNPLRWEELSTSKQNEWKAYRTALLGIPQQSGFPNTITWPTKPE